MRSLMALKEKALGNPEWFRQIIVTGQLAKMVPERQNILRCPRVDWGKYGSMGLRLGRELEKPTPAEPMYTVSHLWIKLMQGVHVFPPLDLREDGSL
jgi:hypothetical protein